MSRGGSAPTEPQFPQCCTQISAGWRGNAFFFEKVVSSSEDPHLPSEKVLLQGVVLFWWVGVLFAFYF